MVRAMNGAPQPAREPSPGPIPGPDFRHVRSWIFDLDNTLYHADCGVFAQIEGRMTEYVARFLGLPRAEAWALQKALYRAHGTTLNGLMKIHGIAPDDYLDYVHDIDLSGLAPDPALIAAVERLPGARYIFTNGCRRHAARILERIGAAHLFGEIWDIRTIGFAPKPEASAYDAVVAASGIAPTRSLGMTTVWLNTGHDFSHGGPVGKSHIDHETDNLADFLHAIRI
jgi:putative hydrolase of the HAD superfamily